jgi:hypothetical protein
MDRARSQSRAGFVRKPRHDQVGVDELGDALDDRRQRPVERCDSIGFFGDHHRAPFASSMAVEQGGRPRSPDEPLLADGNATRLVQERRLEAETLAAGPLRLRRMGAPERRPVEEELLDPTAIQRRYRRQRLRRRALEERAYERQLARLRFWLAVTIVIATSIGLGIVIWNQIQRLFGL